MTEKAATDKDEIPGGSSVAGEGDAAGEATPERPPEDEDTETRGEPPDDGGGAARRSGERPGREDREEDVDLPSGTHDERGGEEVDDDPPAVSPESVEEALAEEELSRALDELQLEFQELNDRHLRLAAEFTNYRRRQEAEMTQAWGRAQSDLVRRFLDVLDDLQRVSGLDPSDDAVSAESIVEGVDLVERKFLRSLEDAGVEVLEPEGEPFDPETMEAMMRVPAESEEDDDLVAQVFQKGYVLKGHLVRPARVSVYKAE